MRYVLAVAAVGLALAALLAVGRPEQARSAEPEAPEGITVTGEGSVESTPDEGEFQLGVSANAATSEAALAANSTRMRRVLAALESAGIAKRDVQTSQVSVTPRYSEDGSPAHGYTAENTVTVTVHQLAHAGAVIDAAVAAGANRLWGPTLSVSAREALYRKALAKAVQAARRKAEAIAETAGVSVGRVTHVVEGGGVAEPPMVYATAERLAKTPIEPGTEHVQASVTVTFAAS
jgi:uncharacterized protein YggE